MRWIPVVAACCSLAPLAFAQETAESCTVCHRGQLSLEGWEVDALAAVIEQMRDGIVDHAVPIPDLDEQEIEALAAALAGS